MNDTHVAAVADFIADQDSITPRQAEPQARELITHLAARDIHLANGAPKNPTDVFTRVLTDNVGSRVGISYTLGGTANGTVESIEAGVLHLSEKSIISPDGTFPNPDESTDAPRTHRYIRIDQLASVQPWTEY